jgi:hypothetical protein
VITAAVVALGAAAPAAALDLTCNTYGDLEICSGEVPSFDGATLDVDLTKPLRPRGAMRHPLIVMLHGFGNDKHEWESLTNAADGRDKWRWNSHWFAQQGYYVLTYTARGFRTGAADDPHEPRTPAGSSVSLPNGTIKLKHRDFEIKDTQWLSALAAEAFPGINPNWVAVTGGSYGGGESWLQASRPRWTFPHEASGGALPVLELQVAVPKYGWTDLAYSLMPNGRPVPEGPAGTVKLSYVNVFYAFGNQDGIFDPLIHVWKARLADAGDPYEGDPIVAQARNELTEFRSSYYQEDGWATQTSGRKTAIFGIQGWTDDLFPADEALRQREYLKQLDAGWPVEVALADVGHPRARSKPGTWRWLNTRAFRFLRAHIRGSHEQQTGVSSEQTTCGSGPGRRLRGLGLRTLTIPFALGGTLTWLGGTGDPDGFETDPVVGFVRDPDRCRVSEAPQWTGRYTALSQPLASSATYLGIGSVRIPYTLLGGTTATLHARVWDVAPSGRAVFVDRGTYRLDLPAGTLELPLFGNHWRFLAGHRIRLDLAQVDEPFLRRSNVPSAINFAAPALTLPVR